jgi:molybdopterin-guanine dinucleotide biosynthesis protein A
VRIAGVILAGGQSSRMGGQDKAMLPFGNHRLIDHVYERLARQIDTIVLNSNGDASRLADLWASVIPDDVGGFAGPLAGVLAAMEWAAGEATPFSHVVTVAADTPFFPEDLVDTLRRSVVDAPDHIGVASSGNRLHPVFALWPVFLKADLRRWLSDDRNRRVVTWIEGHPHRVAEFPVVATQSGVPLDPFFNINTPQELTTARQQWTAAR